MDKSTRKLGEILGNSDCEFETPQSGTQRTQNQPTTQNT